ncbi:MAG: sporulation protein YabP [Clostridia bacterium]
MIEQNSNSEKSSSLKLEDRSKLSVSGVKDVDSFDEQVIIAYTDCGQLTISGSKLHIESLSIEVGELYVVGKISSLVYLDQSPKSQGLIGKLFR